jgi:hypothetical protein
VPFTDVSITIRRTRGGSVSAEEEE